MKDCSEYGMRDDEAVEYVRRDKYDALVAHIQALETAGEDAVLEACAVSQASMEWSRVLNSSPTNSLAQRDAQMAVESECATLREIAEALDDMTGPVDPSGIAKFLRARERAERRKSDVRASFLHHAETYK